MTFSPISPSSTTTGHQKILCQTLLARTSSRGEVTFPCLPAGIDAYLVHLLALFRQQGKILSDSEASQLRQTLHDGLTQGFAQTPNAQLVLRYEIQITPTLQKNLACQVALSLPTVAERYKTWAETKDASMFGTHADAKVLEIVAALPSDGIVLDVGAGTGRNTFPLAQRGLQVDALELTPEFATHLRTIAQTQHLPISVIEGDVLAPETILPSRRYHYGIVSEVTSHFRSVEQLRQLFERLSEAVIPGGVILFNIFLAADGFELDALTREVAQAAWASVFTRSELNQAIANLPLQIVSEESVFEYERSHLPANAFPPTSWFVAWSTGQSVFPGLMQPPLSLHWIVCQRQ
ncbi:class I SAM-dependent methyltransferase [Leptolyngbya sp. GGD]|uniref:class I SAM-dependent methyltransferase n=1 Tax=Leptolyngbya sp. GGD TaxID=2997907 RepID=UPI00227A2325|nr:class I SAM-dependent methyltransferase [Leptolyngbya sp. GGD]MCY6494606.1 class I SAM-dependent methyltransferase [Leptolyngbya sp. GGD]